MTYEDSINEIEKMLVDVWLLSTTNNSDQWQRIGVSISAVRFGVLAFHPEYEELLDDLSLLACIAMIHSL